MILDKKECIHISLVLEQLKKNLLNKEAPALKDLSNKTIHDSCIFQDSASITIATLIYALSKLIEREDYSKIKNWDSFVKKFNGIIDLTIKAINEQDQELYEKYTIQARQALESTSINLKPYIQDVLKKSAINKGSRIHEHGISLGQTSKILGISQWELTEYIGQRSSEVKQDSTINTKTRVKMALEFFS